MYDSEEFVSNEKDFLKRYNNIYISDVDAEILRKYKIEVLNYKNLNELIYDIQYILNTSYND